MEFGSAGARVQRQLGASCFTLLCGGRCSFAAYVFCREPTLASALQMANMGTTPQSGAASISRGARKEVAGRRVHF